MAATTVDLHVEQQIGDVIAEPVYASATIYSGGFVNHDADGYLRDATDAANRRFAGLAMDGVTDATAVSGSTKCRVYKKGRFLVNTSGISQDDVGKYCYLADNQTVCLATACSYQILVGVVVEYVTSSTAYVDIEPGVKGSAPWIFKDVFISGSISVAGVTAQANIEFPVPVTLMRAYITALTAPGASVYCKVKVVYSNATGSQVTKQINILTTATTAENEDCDFSIIPNANVQILAQESATGAATADISVFLAFLQDRP